MEAAARDLEGFRGFKRLKAGKRPAGLNALTTEGYGYVQARAGCNAGTAKADGQRVWWKLLRGIWRVLGVLSV